LHEQSGRATKKASLVKTKGTTRPSGVLSKREKNRRTGKVKNLGAVGCTQAVTRLTRDGQPGGVIGRSRRKKIQEKGCLKKTRTSESLRGELKQRGRGPRSLDETHTGRKKTKSVEKRGEWFSKR